MLFPHPLHAKWDDVDLGSSVDAQEVIALYFDDSAQKLQKLTAKLSSSPPEFAEVDSLVHQFKGSSASFGAQALAMLCVQVIIILLLTI